MHEIYAIRIYENVRMFLNGRWTERNPFGDQYSLFDFIAGGNLIEVDKSQLYASKEVFECIHYPSLEEGGKVIAYYQTKP